jgi:hypothetical protein
MEWEGSVYGSFSRLVLLSWFPCGLATGDPVGENVANGASPPGVGGANVFGDGGETGALTGAGMVVLSLS